MENAQDGFIKFQCEWIKSGQLIVGGLGEIIKWRQIFYDGHLIGSCSGWHKLWQSEHENRRV